MNYVMYIYAANLDIHIIVTLKVVRERLINEIEYSYSTNRRTSMHVPWYP